MGRIALGLLLLWPAVASAQYLANRTDAEISAAYAFCSRGMHIQCEGTPQICRMRFDPGYEKCAEVRHEMAVRPGIVQPPMSNGNRDDEKEWLRGELFIGAPK